MQLSTRFSVKYEYKTKAGSRAVSNMVVQLSAGWNAALAKAQILHYKSEAVSVKILDYKALN